MIKVRVEIRILGPEALFLLKHRVGSAIADNPSASYPVIDRVVNMPVNPEVCLRHLGFQARSVVTSI